MQLEIQVALNFIISYLYNKLPRRRVNIFGEELERQLKKKYEGHWYPDKPYKGSGFRCIHVGEKVDPVVELAAKESGLDIDDVRNNLPQDLSVWIDPFEVSYQIGEKGPVKVLYVDDNNENGSELDKEIKNSFNPEAQVFMPISDPVGASSESSSPSPPFGQSAAVSPSFMPRSTQPLTFTTATFAATKFGSTKMKSSGRCNNSGSSKAARSSPTNNLGLNVNTLLKQKAISTSMHSLYGLGQQQQQQQQQQQSVFVPFNPQQEPPKQSQNQTSQPTSLPPQAQTQGSLQVSANMGMMNGSQMHHVANAGKPQQLPPNFGPAGLFNFSSIFDNNSQVGNNQVWGACHLPARSPPEQSYSAPPAYMSMGQMENMMPPPPPDSSKAPGYRSASQRMVNSPIALTSYATSISGSPVYLHGHTGVGTPSFSRQHFSPHPWSASTSGESPVPPPSTVSSSALSTSAVAPPPQPKPGSSSQQDRKVPPPIGTERLARIRQTGSVNPPLLTTSYTASVGQGGIWSFGVGSASEAMSGWSQPLMSSHMMHPQLQAEQSAFSQHQPMEQDDTGIANPANNYHQPQHLPNSYMDFPKGIPMSMYGGTMLPPHPPMGEGPGGPMYNGLHAGDPAWSPIIKVVPNNADNSDPQQQVWPGTWAPHVGNVHLNHVN